MPKISAPTVKEHRDQVRTRLIDAAENLLRDRGADGLTAGAVSSAAGIARNSIYRYVDSVDDLRGLDVICEVVNPVFHDLEGEKLRA